MGIYAEPRAEANYSETDLGSAEVVLTTLRYIWFIQICLSRTGSGVFRCESECSKLTLDQPRCFQVSGMFSVEVCYDSIPIRWVRVD